ncbi:hypothetical protein GW17_00031787 [Ensete ventricosum]|nr:hypothetical protein GW17_00031787 [Ensete ventricosum]
MYVHKPKDTDKLEHFIKHLVCILTVTARGERSRRYEEAFSICPYRYRKKRSRARAAMARGHPAGEDSAWKMGKLRSRFQSKKENCT